MITDVIKVNTQGDGVKDAVAQTEAAARFCALDEKETLKLRLLAEEMLGLLTGLTGEVDGEFYIETQNKHFSLHLTTFTLMNAEKRKELLDTSTSGTNAAAVGFMGKIRDFYESAFELPEGAPNYFAMGLTDPLMDPVSLEGAAWSLGTYRDAIEDNEEMKEEWDELERSIVANVADEIKIAIKGNNVEMIIEKTFA